MAAACHFMQTFEESLDETLIALQHGLHYIAQHLLTSTLPNVDYQAILLA